MKQPLTEELSKINYLFGYKKGQVISEQSGIQLTEVSIDAKNQGPSTNAAPSTPGGGFPGLTEKQKQASAAGWGPVTDEYAKKLPVGPDGKILPKSNSPKPTVRQMIEKDIANEKLGITWAQLKERFYSSGSGADNELLYKAWKKGWRPGTEVPKEFQTAKYKEYNSSTRISSIDAKPIGKLSTATDANQDSFSAMKTTQP
jgi:hypothetical protein